MKTKEATFKKALAESSVLGFALELGTGAWQKAAKYVLLAPKQGRCTSLESARPSMFE